MAAYRIYRLDIAGHIIGPASDVAFADDEDVASFALTLLTTGTHVEVWQGTRMVYREAA